ncbi:hypothetical protein [Streptomyces sp. bgisy032]|uniref:hypothetical protein n=1 Tax=Streptomyces sp. bgisy032 TaxID=3413773 RepID=UPI003D72F50D
MGIRTLLSRTASGVAPRTVPVFADDASTIRVPGTLTTGLRRVTADLRSRLPHRERPAGPTVTGPTATGPPVTASTATGLTRGAAPSGAVDPARASGMTRNPGKPWADLARGCLTLVLTLLPRPRPAHTTITVYIATSFDALSGPLNGSAPHRRDGRDHRGPEPDATA